MATGENPTVLMCFHCGNETLMKKLATHTIKDSDKIGMDDFGDPLYVVDFVTTWDLCLCPVCKECTLTKEEWCSEDSPFSPGDKIILFPTIKRNSGKIPLKIHAAYEAALRVRRIDGRSAHCHFVEL
ncbi:hypothetical protein NZD89_24410 [Alicyclobacillus fastidiosus]|uniref:Uncharacterized protein n=1 Tax=Alicyclobacillus fastidiosus TaxID=392011 RepID=A0ABY6ZET0_9BACL|nr:hypothetical protein [Alicyclobacillus fastidiosus]WAH41356.1 hypothetical protein NZD89_24410 [Alicyclobacillus fastidiosus]GMA62966.1 hypothetical protein GCM10025859_34060 [Alicyclobacillus fastidiosus]